MPKQRQSANRLTERIHAAVRSSVGAAGVSQLIAACSGGPDSICLTHALAHVAAQEGWQVTVVHVEHNVRPDDHLDTAQVRAFAADLRLPFVHLTLETTGRTDEDRLRDARYSAIARLCAETHADAVLTGHTENDQAETLLLHLLRGSGLDGLTGMRVDATRRVRTSDGITDLRIIRPLLAVRREETVAYCLAHSLVTCDDPTNNDLRYARNWIRHGLLPEIATRYPDIVGVLARNARTIQQDATFVRATTDAAQERCTIQSFPGATILDAATFRSEHPAIQRRVLQRLLDHYGNVQRADMVEAAFHVVSDRRSTDISFVGQMAICAAYESLIVGEESAVRLAISQAALRCHPLIAGGFAVVSGRTYVLTRDDLPAFPHDVFRLDALQSVARTPEADNERKLFFHLPAGAKICVRTRSAGDYFTPAGGRKRRLLRDHLSERRIPVAVRDALPLLVVDGTIAWVMGYDVSAEFVATAEDATHLATLARIESET